MVVVPLASNESEWPVRYYLVSCPAKSPWRQSPADFYQGERYLHLGGWPPVDHFDREQFHRRAGPGHCPEVGAHGEAPAASRPAILRRHRPRFWKERLLLLHHGVQLGDGRGIGLAGEIIGDAAVIAARDRDRLASVNKRNLLLLAAALAAGFASLVERDFNEVGSPSFTATTSILPRRGCDFYGELLRLPVGAGGVVRAAVLGLIERPGLARLQRKLQRDLLRHKKAKRV